MRSFMLRSSNDATLRTSCSVVHEDRTAYVPGKSTTASAKSAYAAGSTTTGSEMPRRLGKADGTTDDRVHSMVSYMMLAVGGTPNHSAGAASKMETTGEPTVGALVDVRLNVKLPLAPSVAPVGPEYMMATPSSPRTGPAQQFRDSNSPSAGAAERKTLAAAGGSASETSNRRTPEMAAVPDGGPVAAAASVPLASGANAATAGKAGGSMAASI